MEERNGSEARFRASVPVSSGGNREPRLCHSGAPEGVSEEL